MLYLLCDPAIADDLNASFARLMRPSHLAVGYTTKYYAVKHTHPTTGYCALAMPNPTMVPVHLESDGHELIALLDGFVADGALTQEEADKVSADVAAAAGQQVDIMDFVPTSWSAYVLTKDQMDADGWFPPVEGE